MKGIYQLQYETSSQLADPGYCHHSDDIDAKDNEDAVIKGKAALEEIRLRRAQSNWKVENPKIVQIITDDL